MDDNALSHLDSVGKAISILKFSCSGFLAESGAMSNSDDAASNPIPEFGSKLSPPLARLSFVALPHVGHSERSNPPIEMHVNHGVESAYLARGVQIR